METIDPSTFCHIVSFLDQESAGSLKLSCHRLAALYDRCIQSLTFAPSTALFTSATTPSTTSTTNADYDSSSLASMETDMNSASEKDEWQFQVTSEITRRVSLLPNRSTGSTLATLPAELQLEIFSYLDKIDSCCLGLSAPNLYIVYRAIHGTKMPLNTRCVGPNSLESAWEVVGKQECKQCGIYRCELHQHIKSWMPKELEYCTMKQNFGLPAKEGAKATCYHGKPGKSRRCSRHPQRTTTIHQDDPTFNLEAPH